MGRKRFNGIVMLLLLGWGWECCQRGDCLFIYFFLKERNSVLNVAKKTGLRLLHIQITPYALIYTPHCVSTRANIHLLTRLWGFLVLFKNWPPAAFP